MPITTHRFVRSAARCSALFVFGALGCSQQSAPQPAAVVEPAVAVAPQPGAPAPAPEARPPAPKPPEPPPTFEFPPDLTGQALSKAIAPAPPAKLPGERFGTEPRPRATPAKYLEPDPLAKTAHALPPVAPAKLPALKPVAPAEKVPVALGAGAGELPAKIVLPVAPVVTARAPDVNVPPPAPLLGRQNTERVPFDDPTSEVGNAVIVANSVPVPLGASGFLKVTVPDPFELAEQVKPSVPPAAEPSAKPVEVNPARAK